MSIIQSTGLTRIRSAILTRKTNTSSPQIRQNLTGFRRVMAKFQIIQFFKRCSKNILLLSY